MKTLGLLYNGMLPSHMKFIHKKIKQEINYSFFNKGISVEKELTGSISFYIQVHSLLCYTYGNINHQIRYSCPVV